MPVAIPISDMLLEQERLQERCGKYLEKLSNGDNGFMGLLRD